MISFNAATDGNYPPGPHSSLKPEHCHGIFNIVKILLLSSLIIISNPAYAQTQLKPYSFGVFPYIPPEKMEQLWSPLTAYISQQLDKPIQLRTRASFDTYKDAIENEVFDIAFMQPFDYANIASTHNYLPLARLVGLMDKKREGMHRAIFVTLKENSQLKISDLRGKTIATPPATAAVTLLGKALLKEHGLIAGRDYKVSTHINHHSCLRQLIINKPVACISAYPAFARFNPITQNRLSIMAYSNAIPSSLIAVHKRVSTQDRKKIKQILLNLHNTPVTRTFLKKAHLADFITTQDADYEPVRKMWKQIKTPSDSQN